jgi:hypothetical protein
VHTNLHFLCRLLWRLYHLYLAFKNSSILQVIYRAIGTLRLWSSLQRPRDRDLYMELCARLEATARDTFSQHGWPHSLRIGASS